jgi:transcriptional regulator with XRE-family HTH domain
MNQSKLLIEALKRYLSHRKITYRDLARKLGQSESNIKRLFSEESFSLKGLEKVCEAAGIDLLELAKLSRPEKEMATTFTEEQEVVLSGDPKLFALLYLLLTRWSTEHICERFEYSMAECDRYLLALDKLGLIRLEADRRFQFLITENIRWIPSGPLNQRYEAAIKSEFLDAAFSGPLERLRFLNARLSKQSLQTLSRRLDRLVAEFVEYAELDGGGERDESRHIWLLIAYRPWRFSVVTRYLKKTGAEK